MLKFKPFPDRYSLHKPHHLLEHQNASPTDNYLSLLSTYRNSPKYSDTLNFWTPIIFCKNNLFVVPNFGQLVKFLSLNFRIRNYDGLEVQQRSAMINLRVPVP